MVESTFGYEQQSRMEHYLPFYEGIYYKNARREDGRNDEEEGKCQCVIMDYENYEHALAQIKLSSQMKYASKVLHISYTEQATKVIYPFFEKTMFQWLQDVKARENMGYGEWKKSEVMPKIRELWKLLHEMKERNIQICKKSTDDKNSTDSGHYMPLIKKGSKLLNLTDGGFVSREAMLLPRVLKLELQEGVDRDKNYAKHVFDEVRNKDKAGDLPEKFKTASNFWSNEIKNDKITSLNYWRCSKHPILYDPADKKWFLLLINDIIFRYGLKGWLNEDENGDEDAAFKWIDFLHDIKRAKDKNKNAYEQILGHKTRQSSGLASKNGKLEEPLSYSAGSDIVRFTRNALMHFEEQYKKGNKNITWHRGLDEHEREIVEILDDELNVCSLHYAIARIIIAEDPPEKYTEEGWKQYQASEWGKLKQRSVAEAEVICQAYQPAPLEVRDSSNNWMEATEFIGLDQSFSLWKKNQPKCWIEAAKIKNDYQENKLDEQEFFAKQGDLKPDWMKFKEIKEKDSELLTNVSGWMKVKEVLKHLLSMRLLVDVNCQWMEEATDTSTETGRNWREATEILKDPTPPRLCTKEGWKLSWMELEEIKNKAKQPLELRTRESWDKGWKKLEEIQNGANQGLKLLTGVSSWMKATEAFSVDEQLMMSLWRRENSRKEDSREGNWKKLKEINSQANKPQELLTRLSSWMKAKEFIGVYELPMHLLTKGGWKILEEIKNETNQQELWTRDGWKALEEIKNEANQQLELRTRVFGWMEFQEIQEIKYNPDQELDLWTMKADWKQAEEIINDDQPPSLWVKKGQDEYWMEAFEAHRPAAEFLTKENWLKAREELVNFFNSLK